MIDLTVNLKNEKTEDYDFEAILNSTFVNADEVLKPQPIAISIGTHEYKNATYPTPYGSYGNFSVIVSGSKVGKTFLKSAITAGYIGGNASVYFSNIKGHNQKNRFVLEFDTEQGIYDVQKVQHRVLEMIGGGYDYYHTFGLRDVEPKNRLKFINDIILNSKYTEKIGLVTIDGLADLITDFNNIEQCTNLSEHLMKWTSIAKIHLIGILHQNFGSAKPMGHIGSIVLRKAETLVTLKNDNGVRTVTADYTRNKPFEPFNFEINNNAIPYLSENNNSKKTKDINF